MPARTMARTAAFMPGASPPLVSTPIVLISLAIKRAPPISGTMDPPEPLRFIQAWSSRYNKFLTISRPYTLYHTLRPEIMDKSRKTYGFILQSVQHPELLHNPCPKCAPIRRAEADHPLPPCAAPAWPCRYLGSGNTPAPCPRRKCCKAGFLPCASAHCRERARSGNTRRPLPRLSHA